jgi:hypothetical protein
MNCTEIRNLLPLFASDDLAAEQKNTIAAHVAACAACTAELADLRGVLGLLDATPAPEVRVDVAAVYRRAAQQQVRRLRRWRRLAAASAAVAAAALVLFLLRGLEFRWEAHQFTLRWGNPPPAAQVANVPPPETVTVRVIEQVPTPPPQTVAVLPPDAEKRLRELDELVRALVADAQQRDGRTQQEVARLNAELLALRRLRQEDAARFAVIEHDVRTLYQAQFPTRRGNGP